MGGAVFAVVEAESVETLPAPSELRAYGIEDRLLTRYRVVDDLGQDLPAVIEASSDIGDGANCGWSLPVGERSMVEFSPLADGFQTSICGCEPPAERVRAYFDPAGNDGPPEAVPPVAKQKK